MATCAGEELTGIGPIPDRQPRVRVRQPADQVDVPRFAASVMDRIAHHATILQTARKSYRLRDAERSKRSKARKSRRAVC